MIGDPYLAIAVSGLVQIEPFPLEKILLLAPTLYWDDYHWARASRRFHHGYVLFDLLERSHATGICLADASVMKNRVCAKHVLSRQYRKVLFCCYYV